jgi:hypothetical protein
MQSINPRQPTFGIDEEMLDVSQEVQGKLLRILLDLQEIQAAEKQGYVIIYNLSEQPWDKDLVKQWMDSECKGKSYCSLYQCAFELLSDASNFVLTWN